MEANEILKELNKIITFEHGKPVLAGSKLLDSELDSFGFTMVVLELDEKYGCFNEKWFKKHADAELLVQTIIYRVQAKCK